ncbi:MAG: hypothetical protein WBG86_06745 [Polyangiales bacterium]
METEEPRNPEPPIVRDTVPHVLDSRWIMAVAVLAVLVAIAWALLDRSSAWPRSEEKPATETTATIELLGAPPDATVTLDGVPIHSTTFGVSPRARHALEVRDAEGRTWRQVFLATGSLSLVVALEPAATTE